jgi:hypothetical protein
MGHKVRTDRLFGSAHSIALTPEGFIGAADLRALGAAAAGYWSQLRNDAPRVEYAREPATRVAVTASPRHDCDDNAGVIARHK